jgi:hypothetical protein
MKEKIIKLAKEKGFLSKGTRTIGNKTDDLTYYLWLCELQKWLRDKHQIFVETSFCHIDTIEHDYAVFIIKSKKLIEGQELTAEIALEKGIFKALKLI